MAEFEYRGFRVRTVFDKDWTIRMWPPLRPARVMEAIKASRAEGENACGSRARLAIDRFVDQLPNRALRGKPNGLTE